MSIVANKKLKVVYGSTTIGLTSSYFIDASRAPIVCGRSGGQFRFACEVVVQADTQSAFQALCTSLEAGFDSLGARNLALVISSDSVTIESLGAANNSGFNARPAITKVGSRTDTVLSRRYAVSVTMDLPALEGGKYGRRDSMWSYSQTDSRKGTVNFTGTYTAVTTNSAYESFQNRFSTYALNVLSVLGGTWEGPLGGSVVVDDEYAVGGVGQAGKILKYSQTYVELIYNLEKYSLTSTVLRRQHLVVSPAIEAPGDYGPGGAVIQRLRRTSVSYSVAVAKNSGDLQDVYASIVKPFLIDEAKKVGSGSQYALAFEAPSFDRAENRISCSLVMLQSGSSNIIRSRVTTEDVSDAGVTLVAKWSGGKLDKERFEGPGQLQRRITQTYTVLGDPIAGLDSSRVQNGGGGKGKGPYGTSLDLVDMFGLSAPPGGVTADTFKTSGGIVEPGNGTLTAVFRNGSIKFDPTFIGGGSSSDPQMQATDITLMRVYEYYSVPKPKAGAAPPTSSSASAGLASNGYTESLAGGGMSSPLAADINAAMGRSNGDYGASAMFSGAP